jgi:ribosome modulation factor
MGDLERIQEDGFMAFIQGKTSHEYPSFRGSRAQQLRQMKAWIRGWRNAKKIKDAKQ